MWPCYRPSKAASKRDIDDEEQEPLSMRIVDHCWSMGWHTEIAWSRRLFLDAYFDKAQQIHARYCNISSHLEVEKKVLSRLPSALMMGDQGARMRVS